MRVKNRKTIWNLSLKSFRASGKRNLIAVVAIVLTTVLFTSLFTIVMSLNESYQTYTFRQIGGYAHGTFKDVTDKQAEEIRGGGDHRGGRLCQSPGRSQLHGRK